MKTQIFTVSAVILVLQGCATAPEEKLSSETDLSQSLPPASAGLPTAPLYFPSAKEAEKALMGYNYALTSQADGSVKAIVSGLVGSGADNTLTKNESALPTIGTLISDLAVSEQNQSPFPRISLPEKTNGQAAIDALGENLDEVAKAYSMSPERLEDILRTDSTAWIDQSGRLLYIDHKQATSPQEVETSNLVSSNTIVSTTNVDAFALHSKPGSNRLIYLDFNGHVAINTAWSNSPLNAQAYDIDGNPSAFSTAELNNIKEIWQRVAEDFAPFDVDVTTEEPALDLIQRTSSNDMQYGTRAVITRSMQELCNKQCGGVAYVNSYSFYSSTYPDAFIPAWVFFDQLANGYPKYVAEAASHEIGHNLNLNHDGTASVGYYTGQGSGTTGWASIMGVGYYKPVTQWDKGEFSGAKNFQDDVAVIAAAGASLRADDFADTAAGASVLDGDATAIAQRGIIERSTDVDWFAFNAGEGVAQITVTPDSTAPNLDVALKLLDAQGNTLAESNPADKLSASFNLTLNSGQYFLQVEGVGAGDLTTGYSDYGSLGQYTITGNFTPANKMPIAPVAVISALPALGDAPLNVQLNGSNSGDSDGTIKSYQWNFGDGTSNTGSASLSHTYQIPGSYTATLTVTDDSGLKSTETQNIQVNQGPALPTGIRVSSTNLTRKISGSKSQCLANVTLKYEGAVVNGARVSGVWSGSVKAGTREIKFTGSGKVTTNKKGVASFVTPRMPKVSKGSCAFEVKDASKSGYTYDGSGEISDSYTW